MDFPSWVAKQPRGVQTRLQKETGLGYQTIWRAAHGKGLSARAAKLISAATAPKDENGEPNGDPLVSIEELVLGTHTAGGESARTVRGAAA